MVVPLDFLTDGQVAAYGRFDGVPSRADLERFFYQVAGIGAKVGAGRLTLQSDRVQTDVALLPKGRPVCLARPASGAFAGYGDPRSFA